MRWFRRKTDGPETSPPGAVPDPVNAASSDFVGGRAHASVGAVPDSAASPTDNSPEVAAGTAPTTQDPVVLRETIIEELRTVYDPEIPVNIYDIGLVYQLDVSPEGKVDVRMTLTSPMCPVAESLPPEVENKIASVPGVSDVKLDLVWEPPWTPAMMSEEARLLLNIG